MQQLTGHRVYFTYPDALDKHGHARTESILVEHGRYQDYDLLTPLGQQQFLAHVKLVSGHQNVKIGIKLEAETEVFPDARDLVSLF